MLSSGNILTVKHVNNEIYELGRKRVMQKHLTFAIIDTGRREPHAGLPEQVMIAEIASTVTSS